MCNCTDCQEDRREDRKIAMLRDEGEDLRPARPILDGCPYEAPVYCTMCNDAYAQSIHDLCNECQDYCDGRLLGGQTPHDEEEG